MNYIFKKLSVLLIACAFLQTLVSCGGAVTRPITSASDIVSDTARGVKKGLHNTYDKTAATFSAMSPVFIATVGTTLDLAYTGKTPIDHIASWIKGRECSVLNIERGEEYCEPKFKEEYVMPIEYCYYGFGNIVECFNRPDPLRAGQEVEDSYTPETKHQQVIRLQREERQRQRRRRMLSQQQDNLMAKVQQTSANAVYGPRGNVIN